MTPKETVELLTQDQNELKPELEAAIAAEAPSPYAAFYGLMEVLIKHPNKVLWAPFMQKVETFFTDDSLKPFADDISFFVLEQLTEKACENKFDRRLIVLHVGDHTREFLNNKEQEMKSGEKYNVFLPAVAEILAAILPDQQELQEELQEAIADGLDVSPTFALTSVEMVLVKNPERANWSSFWEKVEFFMASPDHKEHSDLIAMLMLSGMLNTISNRSFDPKWIVPGVGTKTKEFLNAHERFWGSGLRFL